MYKHIPRLSALPILFLLLSGLNAQGADALSGVGLENEAKAIEGLLIAPCCWRQPVSAHFSPASDEIRREVREMLASGLSREAILEKYIAEYGERILAKPPAQGFGALAYFLPLIFLAAGAVVAFAVVKRLRTPAEAKGLSTARSSIDPKYSRKLEKEMWG